jgi:hypothetical protein
VFEVSVEGLPVVHKQRSLTASGAMEMGSAGMGSIVESSEKQRKQKQKQEQQQQEEQGEQEEQEEQEEGAGGRIRRGGTSGRS